MFSLDPRKQTDRLVTIAFGIMVSCYLIRMAYEAIRPIVPIIVLLAVVVGGVRLWLIWRRY